MTLDFEKTMPRRRVRVVRTSSWFQRWAWNEVPTYRLSLTLGYVIAVTVGMAGFLAGVPAFTIAAPDGWLPVWAGVLVISAGIATIGSVSKRFQKVELIASFFVSAALVAYSGTLLWLAYGLHLDDRAVSSWQSTGLTVPAVLRMAWLMAQVLPRR